MAKQSPKGKLNAFTQKSKLSASMLHYWLRNDLSQKHGDQRYWILVFTKPDGYEHHVGEEVWLVQIKIWDTEYNTWINTITIPDQITKRGLIHIDYKNRRVALITIAGPKKLRVYSFFDSNVLVENSVGDLYKWTHWNNEMTSCILVNTMHEWYELDTVTKEKHVYALLNTPFKDTTDITYVIKIQHVSEDLSVMVIKSRGITDVYHVAVWRKDNNATFTTEKRKSYFIQALLYLKLSATELKTITLENDMLKIGSCQLHSSNLITY